MLGKPKAFVSEPLGVLSKIAGVAEGLACVATCDDGREIQD
jgi:hypothetical protein